MDKCKGTVYYHECHELNNPGYTMSSATGKIEWCYCDKKEHEDFVDLHCLVFYFHNFITSLFTSFLF